MSSKFKSNSNSLVIVESPAKCQKIQSYLGAGYIVMASYGHLRALDKLESIDIGRNFATTYTVLQEPIKLKQIEKLRQAITNATEVILATDDDREGESIAWHICDLFGLSVTKTKRIIFHEITESAIQSAVAHPTTINMELVKAQQARQILDLLVGYTISPVLWHYIAKKHDTGLSAGRCQTPALRLIYENYLDVKDSPGTIAYNTTGYFTNLNLVFELNRQFILKKDIKDFLLLCQKFSFLCTTTLPKKVIKKAPEPLTTSNLQQLASNELHLGPKETMKYAQHLYERGYITYMRTDSKKYSGRFIEDVKEYISKNYEEKYTSPTLSNMAMDANTEPNTITVNAVAAKLNIPAPQEAHEAIRPVNIAVKLVNVDTDADLPAKAVRLYELIWQRTLESCMSSAQYNIISANIVAPMDTKFVYKAEQPVFLGWQIVKNKKDYDPSIYRYLSNLKQNIELSPKKIESQFTLTNQKSHYTEARMVQLLEEKGIGRPSTFASIIEKIQERKYVEKQNIIGKKIEEMDFVWKNNQIEEKLTTKEFGNEKSKLVIQPLGIIVIEFLLSKFNAFFDYEFTKHMEDDLDHIAAKKIIWSVVCQKYYDTLQLATKEVIHLQKFSIDLGSNHTFVIGKYGPVIKHTDPTTNKTIFLPVKKDIDINELKNKISSDIVSVKLEDIIDGTKQHQDAIGKYRGLDLFVKKGKYGIYAQWGSETRSLGAEFSLDNIVYTDIIRFLDKETVLDSSKPVGLVRELTPNLSIRTGKFGDYIFYKATKVKKPTFFKLAGFKDDYKKCDKILILNWIKLTYNI
jgi:DNA topoisomerase-1